MANNEKEKKRWRQKHAKDNEKHLKKFGKTKSSMRYQLRAKIIYNFFLLRDGNECLRCGLPVGKEEASIDHEISFWEEMDAEHSFFDLNNCFLSHQKCNYAHGAEMRKGQTNERQGNVVSIERDKRSFKNHAKKEKGEKGTAA